MPAPTLPDHSTSAFESMRRLPTKAGISFRGSHSRATSPDIVVARGTVATSRSLLVATAGFTSPGIAVVLGESGRDVAPFSAQPGAEETVFLPGTVFHTGWVIDVDGHRVEVIEELTRDAEGQWRSQGTHLSKLAERLRGYFSRARGKACSVSFDYCQRFASEII